MQSLILLWLAWVTTDSLIDLKADLRHAERQQEVLAQHITGLKEEIARREMTSIRLQLGQARTCLEVKKDAPKPQELAYFIQQRAVLNHIIDTLPGCRSEAEQLHEELLSFITDLDNAKLLPPSPDVYASTTQNVMLQN